jgi:hypothetical protein
MQVQSRFSPSSPNELLQQSIMNTMKPILNPEWCVKQEAAQSLWSGLTQAFSAACKAQIIYAASVARLKV